MQCNNNNYVQLQVSVCNHDVWHAYIIKISINNEINHIDKRINYIDRFKQTR